MLASFCCDHLLDRPFSPSRATFALRAHCALPVPRHDNNLTNHNFRSSVAVTRERLKRDKNWRKALKHRRVCIHPSTHKTVPSESADLYYMALNCVCRFTTSLYEPMDLTSPWKKDLKIAFSLQAKRSRQELYVYIIGRFNSARKLDVRNSGQPSSTGEEGTSNEGKASWTIPHLLWRQTLCFYDLSTFTQSSP
jgi:hypothetical protein